MRIFMWKQKRTSGVGYKAAAIYLYGADKKCWKPKHSPAPRWLLGNIGHEYRLDLAQIKNQAREPILCH